MASSNNVKGSNDKLESSPLKPEEGKNNKLEDKSFLEKLRYVKSNITIEPILIGLVIPSMISRLAIQNLNIDKACRVKLNNSDTICDSILHKNTLNLSHVETEIQIVISSIETWRSLIQTAIPTILIIFMGAWSDRTGNRKICILLPVCGEFVTCIGNIISTFYFYEISVEITMLLESLFTAITGGWVMVYLGVFSYLSDITTAEDRTFRVGLANVCLTAGVPIGTSLSGVCLKYLGYYGIFILASTIYLITFSYGYLFLKAIPKRTECAVVKEKESHFMIAIKMLKETATVAFRKRPDNLRAKVICTLLVVAMIYGPNQGERIVSYLYLRHQLQWDVVAYSLYSTYNVILHTAGALFSISVFNKRWGFPDALLCLISVTSKCAGSVLMAFVTKSFHVYMVPLVEILNATAFTSLRSMASKLVSSDELGKMNSLFSLVETLAALTFDPIYSSLYSATVKRFAGVVFLFSAATTIPAATVLIWFLIQYKRERTATRKKRFSHKEST